MFDMCTMGYTAHIDTIFKFLPHTRPHGCIDILYCCNDPCLKVSEVTWQWWDKYFCLLCTKCTLHSNHRLTRVIFQHTKRPLPRSGHFLITYTRIA